MKYMFNLKKNGQPPASRRVDFRLEQAPHPDEGGIQVRRLRPGLILNVTRLGRGAGGQSSFDICEAPILFGFIQAGHNRCTYDQGNLAGQTHELRAGSNSILHMPHTTGLIENNTQMAMCVVSVLASPEFLRGYLSEERERIPRVFRDILEGRSKGQFIWHGSPQPAKENMLNRLLARPYHGGLERMRLESLLLELPSWQLQESFAAARGAPLRSARLRGEDLDRVGLAREILLKRLESPPSLHQLAREAGLNENKLKSGFRQLYGSSVFGYLRNHRLEKAREILEAGRMNVSETAFSVGYASLSHFSRAFRRRYGLNPKDYLQHPRSLPPSEWGDLERGARSH